MNNLYLNRISITTGTPVVSDVPVKVGSSGTSKPFKDVLADKIRQGADIEFSKHAMTRMVERNIPISENSLNRLNQGLKIAKEKGLNDTLILIDKTAFIVSVKNSKVITTVNGEELCGSVFTNIDGTVII